MVVVPIVATAVWVMLPAYIPNNVAVVAGGGRPIDGGRFWRGGRVLGDGKTWRGSIAGVLAGVLLALFLNEIRPGVIALAGIAFPAFPAPVAVTLPTGAVIGDIGSSFLKRRTGRERGAPWPGIDQLDFVVGALVLSLLVAPAWTTSVFTLPVLIAVVVLTPLLHVTTNMIGYSLGLKQEPW